jgi:hypothetical protein
MYDTITRTNTTTAIPIIIEGHETAFNGFYFQFTTGKLLKNLKPPSIIMGMALLVRETG